MIRTLSYILHRHGSKGEVYQDGELEVSCPAVHANWSCSMMTLGDMEAEAEAEAGSEAGSVMVATILALWQIERVAVAGSRTCRRFSAL